MLNGLARFILFLTLLPASLQAAGFDCTKASTFVEKAICSDRELSELDDMLTAAYQKALASSSNPAKTKAEQRQWLNAERNQCKDNQSLKAAYARRLQELTPAVAAASGTAWSGVRQRVGSGLHDQAVLKIANVVAKEFSFELNAYSGAHTGDIEGVAVIAQGKAVYEDRESRCKMLFTLNKDVITIETSPGCDNYGGIGVTFAGTYKRGDTEPKAATLKALGIFRNESRENAFKALVGKDYHLFLENMQLIYEEEDLDHLGATVFSGAVRGLFTIKEAIIMSCPDGLIIAAVIDGDNVRYFTNHPDYKSTMPKTIEEWRERFPDLEIINMTGG